MKLCNYKHLFMKWYWIVSLLSDIKLVDNGLYDFIPIKTWLFREWKFCCYIFPLCVYQFILFMACILFFHWHSHWNAWEHLFSSASVFRRDYQCFRRQKPSNFCDIYIRCVQTQKGNGYISIWCVCAYFTLCHQISFEKKYGDYVSIYSIRSGRKK